jgi:hypothetical protein
MCASVLVCAAILFEEAISEIEVLWTVAPCSLVRGYQHVGRTCHLHL